MTAVMSAAEEAAVAAALARAEQAAAACAGLLVDDGFELEPASHAMLLDQLAPAPGDPPR